MCHTIQQYRMNRLKTDVKFYKMDLVSIANVIVVKLFQASLRFQFIRLVNTDEQYADYIVKNHYFDQLPGLLKNALEIHNGTGSPHLR
jgi:hypothetical protein